MSRTGTVIATAAVVWAAALLLAQLIAVVCRRQKDYSVPAGSPLKGVLFNFTTAMLPAHKETMRLHPIKSAAGVGMHLGALTALAKVLWLLAASGASEWYPPVTIPLLSAAAVCGTYLLVNRVRTPHLRVMSSPDDYLAVVMTVGIIVAAGLHEAGIIGTTTLLLPSAVLFFYLPLGKLKHALFFFIARAEYGSRLGYRGVYPARKAGKEPRVAR